MGTVPRLTSEYFEHCPIGQYKEDAFRWRHLWRTVRFPIIFATTYSKIVQRAWISIDMEVL